MTASGTAYVIAHESEKKMDYDYGMQVFKLEETIVLPNHHNFKLYIYAVERKQIEQD
jgi:hypothetical protein